MEVANRLSVELLPLDVADLHRIPESHYRRHPGSRREKCWFFFDEIQDVPGWERFIRRAPGTATSSRWQRRWARSPLDPCYPPLFTVSPWGSRIAPDPKGGPS